MSVLALQIMETVLSVINDLMKDKEDSDPTRLRLVELRPKAEEFADLILSCSISHNDPENPGDWNDEELPPLMGDNYQPGRVFLELGQNQAWNLRFTIDFTLFYQDLGVSSKVAVTSTETMIAEIGHALFVAGSIPRGRFRPLFGADDYGMRLTNASRCVKRVRILPQGSDEETFFKAKMWLQFEALREP